MMELIKKLIPEKLKYRVILLIIIISLVIILINIAVNAIYHSRYVRRHIDKELNSELIIVSKSISKAYLNGELEELRLILRSIAAVSVFISDIYFLDQDSRLILNIKSRKDFSVPIINDESPQNITKGFSLLQFPILLKKDFKFHLVVEIDDNRIREDVFNHIARIALVSTLVGLLGIALAFWFVVYVTRPIEILSISLDGIDLNRLDRIPQINPALPLEIKQLHASVISLSSRLIAALNQINAKERDLSHSEKLAAIGTFAAGLAHEMKNPIMTIQMLLKTLERDLDLEKHGKDIEILIKESMILEKRVMDFFEFIKPLKINFGNYLIGEILRELENYIQYGMKSIDLEIELDLSQVLYTDKDKLEQVLINLIKNSLEAGADRVSVKGKPEKDHYQLTLSDNGPGFKTHDLNKPFTPFYTTKSSGTGLGLSICRLILQSMAGDISIQNGVGVGAKFIITLPTNKL
ncbi:MAG: HAMP domain-containing histidine kinase [Deltaproteobacteria bacterium]|nr:HAMP domain-containing histidine kinase [Deltaproteobacteria bacterium]